MSPAAVDRVRAIANYQRLVRLPTMSRLDSADVEWGPFDEFLRVLPEMYPALHAALDREIVKGHSLLYRWRGTEDGPVTVLMAHYDVVGASDEGWTSPPFAAEIIGEGDDAVMVGRGVIDDKASLLGILESVEAAVAAGHRPSNDVYLAFSHNEELLGDATPAIVALLDERGIRPGFVLDEGGIVGESIFPGVPDGVVYVGVSEKGVASVRITFTAAGGHASVPPEVTTTAKLARAITEIDRMGALPILNGVTRRMIESVGAVAGGAFRRASELLDSDEDAAIAEFSSVSRDAHAMVHSAPIVTMVSAGEAPNAVPERASAVVNIRIAVGHSAEHMVDRVRDAIGDPDVTFEVVQCLDAVPASPSEGPVWDRLEATIKAVYGDVLVVPYVNNGGTDSRNYSVISDHVYRFNPYDMTLAERRSIHAVDERLRLSSFIDGIEFYSRLLRQL